MSLANRYFTGRLASLTLDTDRQALAERELITFKNLVRIFAKEQLKTGGLFVDLGCGDRYLRPQVEALGMLYIGLDISDCDLMADPIPLESDSADYVVSYSLIEHLPDPDNFFTEVKRILRPGGYLVIETPNWHFSAREFFNDYTHCRPYTPQSLRAICNDYGLKVLCDVPNLRCKPDFFYKLKNRYLVASKIPFSNAATRMIPKVLKGRAKGMIVLASKPHDTD